MSMLYNVLQNKKQNFVFVLPDMKVSQCCLMMAENDIGSLVVMDDEESLIGIVSERDILRKTLCKGLDPEQVTVLDIVHSDVNILHLDDPVEKAMDAMLTMKRRHVLIEDKGKIIAVISIGDLLYYLLQEKTQTIEHLENYIQNG